MTNPFTLYPAIDLKDGACVRLVKGEMNSATVFNDNPGDQAHAFEQMGFDWVHVVDLNGAFDGASSNVDAVASIVRSVSVPIQLGGGIRTMPAVESWLDAGVRRIILGTAAVRDPAFVKAAAAAFEGRIAVGLDSLNGMVAVEGWATATDMPVVDLAKAFEDSGVAAIIATDISRDGTKTGVNVELTSALADAVSIPIIASGGVADINDIKALKQAPGRPISGAILGRALYDGDLDVGAALSLSKC